MQYLYVLSGFNNPNAVFDPFPLIVEQSDGILISLVNIFRIKEHDTKQLTLATKLIENHRTKYLKNKKCNLWIDSGGFNLFEKLELTESSIEDYIKIYNQYLSQHDQFDRIFSLDFPAVKEPSKMNNSWFNSRKMIKKWNIKSQISALETIRKNPELRQKYTFIYQFKTRKIYKIWNEMYRELDLGKEITHRAIGGLVGIHKASKLANHKILVFSPVIGPAYKCLNDYLNAKNFDNDFNLHFLGIRNKIDNFVIILLEKLFTRYLKELGHSRRAIFSIDTRSYSARMDKNIRSEGVFSFDPERFQNKIRRDYRILDIADVRLNAIYFKEYLEYISGEIVEKLPEKLKVDCIADFYPLGIYSNNSLNNYFDYFISENKLIEMVYNIKNRTVLIQSIDKIFEKLLPVPDLSKTTDLASKLPINSFERSQLDEYNRERKKPVTINADVDKLTPLYDIFKNKTYYKKKDNLDNMIKESICRIHEFHRWFFKDMRDPKKLEKLMNKFIKDIGIKDTLK